MKARTQARSLPAKTDLAISMLQKDAISLTLAARIAGKPLDKFMEKLGKRGIKPFKAAIEDVDEVIDRLKGKRC